jgi:DNA invertase Pin-like site-specific DNA recombinase
MIRACGIHNKFPEDELEDLLHLVAGLNRNLMYNLPRPARASSGPLARAAAFAALERAMIRERSRSAMSVKRSRGERISGHAPYGWDFGPGGRLVENGREQQIIARMRMLQEEGMSYRGIAVRLDNEGIRPKRGKRWIHTTVKTILARNAA